MSNEPFTILYLYPEEMSFYGDVGNVLALQKRLQWRGFDSKVHYHRLGEKLPEHIDIVVGGGGQDLGQLKIHSDLMRISSELQRLADNNIPMLMVCGLYQLFGRLFIMSNRQKLTGVGIFSAETTATPKRLIGNIIIDTEFGNLVGFENHSGQTILDAGQKPFGSVIRGYGNAETSKMEGAVYKFVYGTYLHGAILPKNPKLADALITQAMINRYGSAQDLAPLKDELAKKIQKEANSRKS